MTDELLQERYVLAKERLNEISQERNSYFSAMADLLKLIDQAYLSERLDEKKVLLDQLYSGISIESYEQSYANPTYARQQLGKESAPLCFLAAYLYDGIVYAYQKNLFQLVIRMELLLEIYTAYIDGTENVASQVKQAIYYHMYDYSPLLAEEKVRKNIDPSLSFAADLIMTSDLSNTDYLYAYGLPIGENERQISEYLAQLDESTIKQMAFLYVDGYRRGFIASHIDLSKKSSVNIRYTIGFERVIKEAIKQFAELGLAPVIYEMKTWDMSGYTSTAINKQFVYDHRYDDALYRNHAYDMKVLTDVRNQYEQHKDLAKGYAGPAVIEIFGEKKFVPLVKKESVSYTKAQEKESIAFRTKSRLLINEFIPQDEYSFTIIAFPIPEIGPQFEQIFMETLAVNGLDVSLYESIHTKIINALDEGELVRILGKGKNTTNLIVALQPIENHELQTGFENCLADVNIPLGEVFTSPQLSGTCGKLHLPEIYLNDLWYKDLTLYIDQGVISDYSCDNYPEETNNKKYVKENLLFHYDTMPMGEFAIGTNTKAYAMGKRFNISHQLPILIAEKTGPHFAFGDTCYSMSEEIKVTNPDGKEMIAKENDYSLMRKDKPEQAYFHHHTDITIPYDELGEITVLCKDGREIPLILDGKFVLSGTEELNQPL